MRGYNTIVTYNHLETIEYTWFIMDLFTQFRKPLLQIYSDLDNAVLVSIHEDERGLDLVRIEIWKHFAYYNATDHSLSRCLSFLYGVETPINLGKT